MGNMLRSWTTGRAWAVVPDSPFGANSRGAAIEMYATEADAKRAQKFARGEGRIEEVKLRSTELVDGGDF